MMIDVTTLEEALDILRSRGYDIDDENLYGHREAVYRVNGVYRSAEWIIQKATFGGSEQ
jgi:hypothetical protein